MRDLSAIEAGKVLGVTHTTIHNYIKQGLLQAKRVGIRRMIRIEENELRSFAERHQIDFSENELRGIKNND